MTSSVQLHDFKGKKGSYILQIHIGCDYTFSMKSGGEIELEPGRYFYCGSAFGPGGMASRVKRHILRNKKPHWHVDQLTLPFGVQKVALFEDQRECDLLARLLRVPGFGVPIAGFGSSDCARCPSHFVRGPADCDLEHLPVRGAIFVPES